MEQETKSYTSKLLQNEFAKRKENAKNYSIRALARDLEIGKTTIAEVITGKRHLSRSNAMKLAQKLNLSEEELKQILAEKARSSSPQKI